MDNQLTRLTAMLPPSRHAHRFDWAEAESRCGTALPADYKALLDAYGPTGFNNFLWLLFPGDHRYLSLCDEGIRIVQEYLPQLDPDIDPSRYQAWAITDNGDYCLWDKTAPNTTPDPDTWPVVITDTSLNYWDRYPTRNTTAFLAELLAGTLESSVLPLTNDWPQTPIPT